MFSTNKSISSLAHHLVQHFRTKSRRLCKILSYCCDFGHRIQFNDSLGYHRKSRLVFRYITNALNRRCSHSNDDSFPSILPIANDIDINVIRLTICSILFVTILRMEFLSHFFHERSDKNRIMWSNTRFDTMFEKSGHFW